METGRDIVRVQGTTIVAAASAEAGDWREMVARFIAEEDIAESSRALYTRTITQFFQWMESTGRIGIFAAKELDRVDILTYKDYLTEKRLSPLTVGSYIVVVRKFFAFLEAHKIYPNIAKGIKTPKKKHDFKKSHLTDTRCVELLDYEQGESLRDYAIINLILRTGLRTIEVVRADIEDITYKGDRRVLMVWGKGHTCKDDFVVLTDKAYKPIAEYLKSRKASANEPLFTSNSKRNRGERLTTRTISGICKAGLRGIGIDSHLFTAHSLRHTTACAILTHGGQLTDAQGVLRHRSPVTTQIYVESIREQERLAHAPEMVLDGAF
jgi:integrase/recombinase XerD